MSDWWRYVCGVRLALLWVLVTALPAAATNGHLLHGSGAVNESLGGAGTARAFEILGTSLNPATLVAVPDQAAIDVELFAPTRRVSSEVSAGAFGPIFGPPVSLTGSTKSDRPLSVLPAIGVSHTFGPSGVRGALIVQGVAGFGVDYDASGLFLPGPSGRPVGVNPRANPILTPQPPGGYGFGHLFSEYKLMTLKASAAIPVGDAIDVGVALVPALAELQADPFPATAPVDANGDTFTSYPNTGFDKAPGFGFQVGAVLKPLAALRLGLNYSSPIWFEGFRWRVSDEGAPRRTIGFNLDYPGILGAGLSWDARSTTTVLADVRRVFYGVTSGFAKEGFAPDGAVAGFGWRDIWVVGFGVQERLARGVSLRAGYNYNTPPIPDRLSFFNVVSPAVPLHRATVGLGWEFLEHWVLNFAYFHAFQAAVSGPYQTPGGAVAGTSVTSAMYENSWSVQANYVF